jgi:translation initiation factor 3 subunit L
MGYGAPPPVPGYGMPVPYLPQGAPPMDPPLVPTLEAADHPDLFIPKPVAEFLPRFRRNITEKNVQEILNIYEIEFNKLSDRWFTEDPWPEAERVATLDGVGNDEVFLTLYKELYFRHIYAKHKPTIDHRFDSFSNYCNLFNLILHTEEPIDLELPNKWLWDIIDEFIYQFQSFVQFRGKLKARSTDEIVSLKENQKIWNIHSVLNVLYSLVAKSNINQQLEAFYAGDRLEPGAFGSHSLYKNLGYFSLIGLLRLHTQLGDYYQALQCVTNVQLSKKVLTVTRVPAGQISLYYFVGFCYFMMRRYKDTVRTFSNIIVFIQRAKQHFQPKSYQLDLVLKQNEQMLSILAMLITLSPQHVDEVVNSQLKQERYTDKMAKLQKGDLKTFEEMFMFACPKFMAPVPPDYDSLPENYNKEPTRYQCSLFLSEVEQQLILPIIRSYLKFYTTMPISKLASFMEVDEPTLREHLLRFKHKTRTLVSTSKGIRHLSGETQSASDLDFYIDGVRASLLSPW